MEKFDRQWHVDDIAGEFQELQEARGFLHRWSELSDVVYTYTRSRWTGFRDIPRPVSVAAMWWGSLYMIPKYTLRYLFFRRVGTMVGVSKPLRVVRNPYKVQKLHVIARENGLDPVAFEQAAKQLLRRWPLLK